MCNARSVCPAVVVMLRSVLDMKHKDIVSATGYSSQSVGNVISKKCPELKHWHTDKHTRRSGGDKSKRAEFWGLVMSEYEGGSSSYELAEKYGVGSSTIRKQVRKAGLSNLGVAKRRQSQREAAIKRIEGKLLGECSNISLVVYNNKHSIVFKCNVCGCAFTRTYEWHRYDMSCPSCKQREMERRKERRKEQNQQEQEKLEALRRAERATEYEKEKICPSCGGVFHSESKRKIYCSGTCSRREKRKRNTAAGKTKQSYGNHRKRARERGLAYEPGITLKKLVERDNNVCQICGEPCNANDLRWGYSGPLYPSIDHIIAIANGGGHTWDNVQLAHVICNSYKRDLLEGELTDEVVSHAKEQAIAYKCA